MNEVVSNSIDDMRAYQTHYNLMQERIEEQIAEDRARAHAEGGSGIRAQIERGNVATYESFNVADIERILNELSRELNPSYTPGGDFILHTGERGMQEFSKSMKKLTREGMTVEELKDLFKEEMKL